MGGYYVEDRAERKRLLGPWAALDNIILVRRAWDQVEYYAHAASRPGGPTHCKIDHCHDGRHDYRHMTGRGHNDLGGYVVLEASKEGRKVTRIKRCDKYGPLRCRYCGDKYDVDAEIRALKAAGRKKAGMKVAA